jgi:hypothetical protein
MNIIRKQVKKRIRLVEIFSGKISMQTDNTPISIYQNICASEYLFLLLKRNAINTMQDSLANSEGWKLMSPKLIQRLASLVSTPAPEERVRIKNSIETGNRAIRMEKNLLGILCITKIKAKPIIRKDA